MAHPTRNLPQPQPPSKGAANHVKAPGIPQAADSTPSNLLISRPRGLIRDSKDPNGPALAIDVAAFVQAIKDGRFEH
ncbi:hypothetical protein BJ970_006075 [Saccharopolyspora phatthalungensis]|uniref:DUF397 domain-containing protein n=1 Tax=Saccharopolyspora phatthalungensis TaxID=664693 RepID=A0A840QDI9_9PSEU|nr:hypothetical protein [Saccharopolyspora phatthalungensis]